MLSFFPRGVLDEILNLIESVSEEFPSYSYIQTNELMKLNEHQRSRSLFDLGHRSLRFQNSTIVSLGTKFLTKAYG